MDTTLKLYQFDGQDNIPFPYNGGGYIGEQAELLDFTVNKTRMGAAPTITGTLEYPVCLDSVWEANGHFDDVFVVFNGEKYYLKATPTSSKSNDKRFYKHELTFVSERSVLETVYMIDDNENQTSDILYSNNTQYTFFGNIHDFAERINQSMYFSKIGDTCMYRDDGQGGMEIVDIDERILVGDGYYVVVDSSVTITDEVLITLNNNTVSDALKQIFEQFGVPYYFVGKVIHIGNYEPISETVPTYADSSGVIGAGLESGSLVPYEYGQPNAVLNVSRNNGTKQIYNRCSGTGSGDNIPYYYPNPSPSGFLKIEAASTNIGAETEDFSIIDMLLFSQKMKVGSTCTYKGQYASISTPAAVFLAPFINYDPNAGSIGRITRRLTLPQRIDLSVQGEQDFVTTDGYYTFEISGILGNGDNLYFMNSLTIRVPLGQLETEETTMPLANMSATVYTYGHYSNGYFYPLGYDGYVKTLIASDGYRFFAQDNYVYKIVVTYQIDEQVFLDMSPQGDFLIEMTSGFNGVSLWAIDNEQNPVNYVKLSEIGVAIDDSATLEEGDFFYQRLDKWIMPQQKLMPRCYRLSDGTKRFYPARNYPMHNVSGNNYEIDPDLGDVVISNTLENDNYKENGTYLHFDNPHRKLKQKEHIEDFPEIKPSIVGITNADGRRIDMIADIAFDTNDDNSGYYDDNGNFAYNHPYFFVKLRKTNGTNGFNLFDNAIDEAEMTIAMTSGHCAPCEFVIGVDEDTQKNLVQVDETYGTLKRDADGDVIGGRKGETITAQARQNNTSDYEVWVALKKDIETYGELMPYNDTSVQIRPKECSSSLDDDGDTFVILHIQLPDAYIVAAEHRLTEEIIKWMNENNSEKFNFSLKFSRVFLGDNTDLVDILNENVKVSAKYNGVTKQFFVSSYSYSMKSSSPIPEITISGLVETVEELKSVASAGGFANSVASHISENFQELMMGLNKPFTRIINQNNTNVTNQIKGDFPTDYVRTVVDLFANHIIIGEGGRRVKSLPNGENNKVLKMVDGIPSWADILYGTDKKLSTAASVSDNYGVVSALNTDIEEDGTFLIIAQLGFAISNNQQHNAVRVVNAIISVDEGKNALSSGATELYSAGQITLVAFATLQKETKVKIYVKCDTTSVVDIVPQYTHDFATSLKTIRIA